MPNKKFNIVFDASMNISQVKTAVGEIQKSLSGVSMPQNISTRFAKTFEKLNQEIANFEQQAAKGLTEIGDFRNITKAGQNILKYYQDIQATVRQLGNLSDRELAKLFPADVSAKIEKANKAMQEYSASIKKAENKIETQNKAVAKQMSTVGKLKTELDDLKKVKPATDDQFKQLEVQIISAKNALDAYEKQQKKTFQENLAIKLNKEKEFANKGKNPENLKYSQPWRDANKAVEEYTQTVAEAKFKIQQLEQEKKKLVKKEELGLKIDEKNQELETARNKLAELRTELEKMRGAGNTEAFSKLVEEIGKIEGIDVTKLQTLDDVSQALSSLNTNALEQIRENMGSVVQSTINAGPAFSNLASNIDTAEVSLKQFNARTQEIEGLKQQITYFFGLSNSIELFKRAVRSAYETVKELDEVMTQTAVVTDFTVGDMWSQLPEYTKRANELGVAVKGAYESATLYYQQGLDTNEVIAVSSETLKMARIAGMDYADATNYMTAALRGFNMEINETNAQRINDVYSELAAITASDTQEIATAMTKTASIASNAGMEFETTAAFLSQIIETTREAPETAGTALKTVIARFQELKKDPSLIGEVDGEVVDANKIETALRTIDVALRDTNGQFRDLDSVFLEIAQKWNTLDTNTQRYIATMAAGSRQQSRFIAMMSDYTRTMELVNAANNSAGASQQQFEKTLDSLESKLAKLDNAWNEFTMGLANNEAIKLGVDALTLLLNIVNDLTGILPEGIDGIAKLGIALLGLKTGGRIFDNFFLTLKTMGPAAASISAVTESLSSIKNVVTKDFWYIPRFDKNSKEAINFKNSLDKLRNSQIEYNDILLDSTVNDTAKQLSLSLLNESQNNIIEATAKLGITEGQTTAIINSGLSVEHQALALSNKNTAAKIAEALATEKLTKEEKEQIIAQQLSNAENQKGLIGQLANTAGKIASAVGTTKLGKALGFATLGEKLLGKAAMSTGAKLAASLGIIGAIIIAIPILFNWAKKAFEYIKSQTPEEKFKQLQNATEQAGEAAKETSNKYNELKENLDSLDEKYENINNLTVGTQAWRDAVQETNQQVLELVNTYKELAKYVKVENGVLTLDIDSAEVQNIIKGYSENVIKSQIAQISSQAAIQEAEQRRAYEAYRTKMGLSSNYTRNDRIAESNQALRYYNGLDGVGDTSEKANALRELGEKLTLGGNTISALYSGVISNAYAGIEGDFNQETLNRMNNIASPEVIKNLIEAEKQNIDIDEKRDSIIFDYASAQGYTSNTGFKIDGNEITWDEQDKPIIVDDEILKQFAATSNITSELTNAMETMQNRYDSDGLNAFFSGSEGKGFTQQNINEITDPQAYAEQAYNELSKELQEFYGSPENFGKIFTESYNIAADDFVKSQERLNEAGLEKINLSELNENLDYGAVSGLSRNFLEVNERLGSGAATAIYDLLEDSFEGMDSEQANKFASVLNGIDWSNASQVETLSENLNEMGSELGFTETETFNLEQQLLKLAGAMREVDVTNLLTQTKELRDTADNIKDRETSEGITQEEYDLIAGTNKFDMSQFEWTGQEYVYTAGTMNKLAEVLKEVAGQLAIEGAAADTTNNAKLRQEALLASGSAVQISKETSYSSEERESAIKAIKNNEELASSISAITKSYKGNTKEFKRFDEHVIDLAFNSKKAAKEFGGLNDIINDNIEILKDPSSDPQGYLNAINNIANNATVAFGTEVNTDFVYDNIQKFLEIGEGGEKAKIAYKELGEKVAENFIIGLKGTENEVQYTVTEIVSFINEQYPTLEVGGSFDASAIFNTFAETAEAAGRLQTILNALGYSTSFEGITYDLEKEVNINGKTVKFTQTGITEENLSAFTGQGYKISKTNFDALGTQFDPSKFNSPTTKGSTSEWKNPYDKQYNTIEKINEELRKREILEKNFQRLQSQGKTTALGTLDYYKQLYNNLEGQIPLQNQLLEGRREELATLTKKNAKYTKYGSYNEETGLIDIKWDDIDAIKKTDTKTGEAVENYISELERIAGSIEDTKSEILDIKQQQEDIKQELIDTYLGFEERVAAAMEARDQKEIDVLQENFDALTEAEEALADSISKSIDEMRQARENEKTEDEIAEKERRLAYLRQDTTGSNALEIKRLEEEIADQREEYQDALVDQALTNLQEQNEAAAEQRQRQIELMQSQLEYNVENGIYTKQVKELIESAMKNDHMLTEDDELYKILNDGENWRALSPQGLEDMLRKLNEEFNKSYTALNGNFGEEELKDSYSDYMAEMVRRYINNGGNITQDILKLNEMRNAKINASDYTGSQTTINSEAALKKELDKHYTTHMTTAGTEPITSSSTKNYVVKKNDSLSKIARDELGDMSRWKEIAELNNLKEPYTIYEGKTIKIPAYKTGGIADFTGPAWLDGSKSKPELILNARDTENFIILKDVLSGILSGTSSIKDKGGDNYFDIDIQVDEIANDYDVDQMAERIKQNIYEDSTYRNVNAINFLR